MVKTLTAWGFPFFKNDDSHGGAQADAINIADGRIVVCSQTKKHGRMWGVVPPNACLKLLMKNRGIYEIITKFPHKVYFDIDSKDGKCDLPTLKRIITKYFPDAEFAISGSVTTEKTSYHITLQNYVIHDENERTYVKNVVEFIHQNEDTAFDTKVYTKNRLMKCINQSKLDGRVQEILENDDYKAHLITHYITSYPLKFPEIKNEKLKLQVKIEEAKKPFDIGSLPKLNLTVPDNIVFSELTPIEVLGLLPISEKHDHKYTHMVARFCFTYGIPFETYLTWRIKKNDSDEIRKKWAKHYSELDKFSLVSLERMKNILTHSYPKIKKDRFYRAFQSSFDFNIERIKVESLAQEHFQGEEKYMVINIGMGGGKTQQTGQFLKGVQSFAWIAPNKALANNTLQRLKDNKIDIKYYLDEKTKDKAKGCLTAYDKMLIVANSLHYLKDKTYDVLVIDEIETLIDRWQGNFMTHKKENWTAFLNIVRSAKKVILLDAFITTKTIKLFKAINDASMVVYERIVEPITREVVYVSDFKICVQDILRDLKNDKKLFIFYPYKNQSLYKNEYVAMEALYNLIVSETGKQGKFYNADIDEAVKSGLQDVNVSWKHDDFIITNSMITCGVNYDSVKEEFDKEYIFVSSFTVPRDVAQVSYRPRNLSSNTIQVCFMGKMVQQKTWEVDVSEMGCKIYSDMIDSILTEKKSPIRKTVELFFAKAHYKQRVSDMKLTDKLSNEICEMLAKYENTISYTSVPDIDFSYAEHIQQLLFAGEATMMDKFMLQKYFFKRQFACKGVLYEGMDAIAYAWDANYSYFFKQAKRLISDQSNVFHSIQKLNKLKTIFPVDVRKTKLSPEILDVIFTEFKFKFIKRDSFAPKIIEEIYNNFFNLKIVKTHYSTEGSDKNVVYEVINYDEVTFFFEFVAKYDIDFLPESDRDVEEVCFFKARKTMSAEVVQTLQKLAAEERKLQNADAYKFETKRKLKEMQVINELLGCDETPEESLYKHCNNGTQLEITEFLE